MNKDSILRMILWIGPIVIQLLIAATMVRRKLVGSFPIFFSYTLMVPVRDLVLLLLRSMRLYSWVYWIGESIIAVVVIAVIYEVLQRLVEPYSSLQKLGLGVFWVTMAAVVVLAAEMVVRSPDFGPGSPFIKSIILLERSVRFVQVGLLVAFIVLITRMGLTWKHYVAGIIVGFGLAAGLQLLLSEMLASLQLIGNDTFVLLKPAAYDCAVLIWAFYFSFPQRQERKLERIPDNDLPEWDRLIGRYLGT